MTVTIDHAERAKRMHATDVAAVMGLSPKRTSHTVWLEKTGRLEPWEGNKATDMGQRLESPILDVAEEELGPLERDVFCLADGTDFPLAATLDARVIASGIPCEAKTSGIVGPVYGEWGDQGTDVIPPLYLVQTSVQMLCSQAELAYVFALLGGRGIVRYRVARDKDVLQWILETCGAWWRQHIELGIEPVRTEAIPMEIIKRMRRQPDKVVSLDDAGTALAAEFEIAKATKLAAEKAHEAAQSNLIAALGDAEAGTLPDGRQVMYMQQSRKGYTVSESTFRVLRITKG